MIMEKIKKYLTPSCLKRAGKTFVEAALSYVIINLDAIFAADSGTVSTILQTVLLSSIAAGISAVWNLKKEDIQI